MSFYNNKNTVGQHGFYFFFGVVEDRHDPMKIGRVRVRCHGIHSPSKTDIPTDHLPWATAIVPTTSNESDMSDLKIGCNVFGFFADGEEMQVPMIMGVVPGIVSELIAGNAPTRPSEAPQQAIGDSSVSAYAVGGKRLAGVSKANHRQVGIPTIGGTFDEPPDPYAGQYPFVHPNESESGHVIELDDTPGHERVHIFHRSGSYVEMHADGKVVIKSIDDSFELSMKDKNVFAKGNLNLVTESVLNINSPIGVTISTPIVSISDSLSVGNGATGMITDINGKTATFVSGICTDITP